MPDGSGVFNSLKSSLCDNTKMEENNKKTLTNIGFPNSQF